jgi:16S rRNA processing protein RimM
MTAGSVGPGQDDGDSIVVGRIGRAHGIRGDVAVELRTDAPELRFRLGSVLRTDPALPAPLVVTMAREHSSRFLVHFDGIEDRTSAEQLNGMLLLIDLADAGEAGKPDEDVWWDHQLVGLQVRDMAGADFGVVQEVVHSAGGDLLAVDRVTATDGPTEADAQSRVQVLVPFVAEIVPTVDVAGGYLVVDPPEGLLDL